MCLSEALPPRSLCTRCDPDRFSFGDTRELPELTEPLGQERALEALRFAVATRRPGYHAFVLGPPGVGKHRAVRQLLAQTAAGEPPPRDVCYVHDFARPQRPRSLRLPAGRGGALRDEMAGFVERLRTLLPAAFESDEYRTRLKALEDKHDERREGAFRALRQKGAGLDVAVVQTPQGIAIAPLRDGEVIDSSQFERLPPELAARYREGLRTMEAALTEALERLPGWEREHQDAVTELNRATALRTVGGLVDELRARWAGWPDVLAYLDAVQKDAVANVHEIVGGHDGGLGAALPHALRHLLVDAPVLDRYRVNLLVDHAGETHAPVVFEDSPTVPRLIGRVEHRSHLGALVTDLTLVRAGALHRADGGYLVLDVRAVLRQPYAWETLERALRSSEVRIESLAETMGLLSAATLEPEPVPIDVKVVLVGDRYLYYLLAELDPDFLELFKVAADFEEDLPRTPESELHYAALLGSIARAEGLVPLDRAGAARMVELAAREAGDARKLTTNVRVVADVLREADHLARTADHAVAGEGEVLTALRAKERRLGRLRERVQERIRRGTILIDTRGECVGRVNGLSVVRLGSYTFGFPARISARVRLGGGEVVDIERETELGGPLHAKGVLILAGYLGARYAAHRPMSLAASLVFEQSYGPVEGDSASAAELFALLSALAGVAVRQSLAVTGSVNQHGEIQPVGAVNEKIEGFFDVCRDAGLNGTQGVLIPAANVDDLMLRDEVVAGAAEGLFHVHPVRTVDEGIGLLTGLSVGERDDTGRYPAGSINRRVEERLAVFAEEARVHAVTVGRRTE